MASPRATQFERYWRERIADEISSLLSRSWDGDLHGMTYSDGIHDALKATRGPHEGDDRTVEAAQEEGRHEVGMEEAQGRRAGQPGVPDYRRGRLDAAEAVMRYADETHRHSGVLCSPEHGDRCDITAALRVASMIARGGDR